MMKKPVYLLGTIFLLYVILEICFRLVLSLSTGASFIQPGNLIYKYYPELKSIQQAQISNTDSTLDVLILSCSVLHKDWADIVNEMNRCIKLPVGFNALKIYNASGIGHGSRDNLIKYSLLAERHFDVVVYYDAINDARLNNCPPEVFKSDYSHYLWYDEINHIIANPEMNYTVIPFFYDWIKIRAKAFFKPKAYIPVHFALRPLWLEYGNDYKSLDSYHNNLESVMDEAGRQHAQFLYLTFAYYLPTNYSLKAFREKKLDYSFCDHSRETEIWGKPENVEGFINMINSSSKSWLAGRSNVRWFDLDSRFPKSGVYFADVCHFSPMGIPQFATIACSQIDSIFIPAK